MILGLAGPAGCGKDTIARLLIEKYGFRQQSFAGPLKRMLAAVGLPDPIDQDAKEAIIPWLGVSYRHAAQTLGTEWGRHLINPDIWVIMSLNNLDEKQHYIFSDVRFENEATAIRKSGGRVVHIYGRAHKMTGRTKKHASETGIVERAGDCGINNGGTLADLELAVLDMYEAVCA